jgi:hypothetical protein
MVCKKSLSVLKDEHSQALAALRAVTAVFGRAVENTSRAWLAGQPAAAALAAQARAKTAMERAKARSNEAYAAYMAAAKAGMKKPRVAMAAR